MEKQFELYVFDEEDGMFEKSAGGLQEPVGKEDWASMTVVDLTQCSGSDREVSMRPCQERAHTKKKRERGVGKCAVHSCSETFRGLPRCFTTFGGTMLEGHRLLRSLCLS